MKTESENYVHALRFQFLTRYYDAVLAMGLRENTFKSALIAQAAIRDGDRVLDLACGTATLTILAKQGHPGATVTGVDGDPKILDLAKKKAAQTNVDLRFDEGLSFSLPYENQSFDCVLSSLFFHHLTTADKERTAKELFRVLKPEGELHVADWGRPQNIMMRAMFTFVRVLDGFAVTSDNVSGLLPAHFERAGFECVATRSEFATLLGTVALYSAKKPG